MQTNRTQKRALINSKKTVLREREDRERGWFSRLLQHPARKWSGSILTTPECARGFTCINSWKEVSFTTTYSWCEWSGRSGAAVYWQCVAVLHSVSAAPALSVDNATQQVSTAVSEMSPAAAADTWPTVSRHPCQHHREQRRPSTQRAPCQIWQRRQNHIKNSSKQNRLFLHCWRFGLYQRPSPDEGLTETEASTM